jgi:hypothetical protein
MKSRMSRLTSTGHRVCGRCPAPSSTTSRAPVSSATLCICSCGRHRSAPGRITRTGHRTDLSSASASARLATHISASTLTIIASPVVCNAQPIASSRCLLECGSLSTVSKKNRANPG